jgi:hypothetical protein
MIETMYHNKGVGLAAPQVGINEQILVADIGEGPMAVINPRILKKSGRETLEEGCLSLPGVNVNVRRAKKIVVSFLNQDNQKVQKSFDGELERVSMGTETVNGQPAEKFKVTYKENGQDVVVYQWLMDGLIPVKVEAVDGSYSMDYKNLQIGNQPADLFEPPTGFEEMQMPSLDLKSMMGL